MPTAFVTGGTGFIGINLVKLLVENSWDVYSLHRPSSDLTFIKKFPVKLREGSVTDRASLLAAIPDRTDAVFHLAGDTNLWSRHNDRQREINVGGTINIMEAAREKNVATFIHTSSTSAWGSMSGKTISEELPQTGRDSWVNYERTKWAGEQEVLARAPRGMKVVILNPAAVTGPHDKTNWGRLFFALRDGQLPGIPDGILSVNHVREVARAHLSAIEQGRHGERYILAGEDCKFSAFVEEIARVSGVDKLPKKIPTPFLKLLSRLALITSNLKGTKPGLTPELVKLMTRKNLSYSSRKAMDELGYRIVPMRESVRDCYQWLKQENLL